MSLSLKGNMSESASEFPQNQSPNHQTSDTLAHTPRRSSRKSIKPKQEYEDIISSKRQLRSTSKVCVESTGEVNEEPLPKWTPAKVGRVSQKRSRRSRRNSQACSKENNFDMSDFGITPLIDEDDENKINCKENTKKSLNDSIHKTSNVAEVTDVEILPVTIIKEDYSERIMKEKTQISLNKANFAKDANEFDIPVITINDETLNNSDCMLVNANIVEQEEDMQPLQFSDEESCSTPCKKTPDTLTTEVVPLTLNSSVPSTTAGTPKRFSNTAQRKPTPYKPKVAFDHHEDDVDEKEHEEEASVMITVSTMEPKEIVLRSIRKRSLSVCIDGAEAKNRRKNVTFYSPANQTTILEQLDMQIEKSVKENGSTNSCGNETFVTQRRKRSMSFDEALINRSKFRSQTPVKGETTPHKSKPIRTKLPNFAAIHKKNFEGMENLLDHVNRKAERAKILTNSASKQRSASAQKPAKVQQDTKTTTGIAGKPKAVKRIDLPISANSTFSGISSSLLHKAPDARNKNPNVSMLPIPRIAVCKPILTTTQTTHKENRELVLPNPRMAIIKPHTIIKANTKNIQSTPAKTVLKATQTKQVARPPFNLSTAFETKSANAVADPLNKDTTKKTKLKSATAPPATLTVDEKMAKRRQRHMDMFKGRGANVHTTPGSAEKKYSQIIRGVRSNRRFELQMAHRMNMEH